MRVLDSGTWGGTRNTELCRFLAKSKFRYKNPLRTPYKPLVEIMKIKWNKKIWCSRGVHGQEKITHESFVSSWFSSSGTQDVSVARWAPSNPFCPVAWYPRKPFRESLWGFYASCHQAFVRFAHFCPLSFLSLRKQAFSAINDNVQALRAAWCL